MFTLWELLRRRIVSWAVGFLVALLAARGIVGPEIVQSVTLFVEAFIGVVFVIVAEFVKILLDKRDRDKGKVIPDLVESNRISSLRDQLFL